jgi:hypothetical protein
MDKTQHRMKKGSKKHLEKQQKRKHRRTRYTADGFENLLNMNIKKLLTWHRDNWMDDGLYLKINKGNFAKVISYFINNIKQIETYPVKQYSQYNSWKNMLENIDDLFKHKGSVVEYILDLCVDHTHFHPHVKQIIGHYLLFRRYTIIDMVEISEKSKYEKEMLWSKNGWKSINVSWNSDQYNGFCASLCLWDLMKDYEGNVKYSFYFWDKLRLKQPTSINNYRIPKLAYNWFVLSIWSDIYHDHLGKFNMSGLLKNNDIKSRIRDRIILYHNWLSDKNFDFRERLRLGGSSVTLLMGHRISKDIDVYLHMPKSNINTKIDEDTRHKIDVKYYNNKQYGEMNYYYFNPLYHFYLFGFNLRSIHYTIGSKMTAAFESNSKSTSADIYYFRANYGMNIPYYTMKTKDFAITKKRLYFKYNHQVDIDMIKKDYKSAEKIHKNTLTNTTEIPADIQIVPDNMLCYI